METSPSNTDELVRRAGQGDAAAIDALLARHRERLAQMVRVRMDPRMRARIDPSDVIQETLAAANERMAQYLNERPIPFYPWLRQIAWEKLVHLHDRHLRAAKRTVTREQLLRPDISDESAQGLAERLLGSATSPSSAAVRKEMRSRVRQALDALPEADRELLLMRYLEQLSSEEIAATMEISAGAVNMRQMRALERMRKMLLRDSLEM